MLSPGTVDKRGPSVTSLHALSQPTTGENEANGCTSTIAEFK